MGLEIERKFLVIGESWRAAALDGRRVRQGYLSTTPGRTVRVRTLGTAAFLTVKGRREGLGRAEFEYPIPPEDAAYMLDVLCQQPLVEKTRYHVPVAGLTWEVDEFTGENAGLVIAEVELERPDQAVELPAWAGAEVSTDYRYTNVYLAQHPYRSWEASHEDRHRE